jgi:CBS domain-containing protein
MASVQDLITGKGSQVYWTTADASVLDAVSKMNQHKVGALVVMDGERMAGIFTERDVLKRVVGERRSPLETKVGDIMTRDVVCCGPQEEVDEVAAVMKNRRIRHVPVCGDDGKLAGMVSIGDINAYNASHQEATIQFLNDYIYGRA